MSVDVGTVGTFEGVEPSKAQALKVLEEAAEVFGAWQAWESYEGSKTEVLAECADVVQATCNLMAALGCKDATGFLMDCRNRNVARGRDYEPEREVPRAEGLATSKQVGQVLGITQQHVRTLAKAGEIPYVKVGRAYRYDLAEVVDAYGIHPKWQRKNSGKSELS
jgi:excisionase family DNA binding protein